MSQHTDAQDESAVLALFKRIPVWGTEIGESWQLQDAGITPARIWAAVDRLTKSGKLVRRDGGPWRLA